MSLLELRILEIHSFPHFSLTCCDIYCTSTVSTVRLHQVLLIFTLTICLLFVWQRKSPSTTVFSAREPKAQVHYCDHALSVVHLNRIQRNFTGSKISTPSSKFVFFGPIGKTRWPPWPMIGWDIFDFSSETAERNPTKLDRKQDLNVLYQVCVFRADRKNKMAALANSSKRWHIVLRCTICGPLGLLFMPLT